MRRSGEVALEGALDVRSEDPAGEADVMVRDQNRI